MDSPKDTISGQLKARLERVNNRIREAAVRAGRAPEGVRLVAVSKTIPPQRIREAVGAGVFILGENYIQEARDKIEALEDHPVSWHFIGHLQSNKAKYAVRLFDLVHTVDSIKLARELDRQAAKRDKTQQVLLQVNISEETTKSGVSVEQVLPLARAVSGMDHLRLKGLMTMPPFFDQPDRARPYFAALRQLRDRLLSELEAEALGELSMGMTGDFEVAVEEGATLVRIGTAIFGERS
jgi:pyridoxal phosphate enzyme (YggS family)